MKSSVLIIGQAFLDIDRSKKPRPECRIGGILHSARAAAAVNAEYVVAYIAPEYLDEAVFEALEGLNPAKVIKIGNVYGAPNILDIHEPKEVGEQGYYMPLYERHDASLDLRPLVDFINCDSHFEALIQAGQFELVEIAEALTKRKISISVDLGNVGKEEWLKVRSQSIRFGTVFLSTSSFLFYETFQGSVGIMQKELAMLADAVVIKENRGGSRYFNLQNSSEKYPIPSHTSLIAHSVGVGDCYDAVYLINRERLGVNGSLHLASAIAMEYAATADNGAFSRAAQNWLKIKQEELCDLKGTSLPWEMRPLINIYVAAPDFTSCDRTSINKVVEILKYHNFAPRLPVRENGELTEASTSDDRAKMFKDDMELLSKSNVVVAVLPFPDPGSLVEIGIAVERKIPVIVFVPDRDETNIMLTESARCVTSDLDEFVSCLFEVCSEVAKNA